MVKLVDFSKYKIKEESKKIPDSQEKKKIIPGEIDQKVACARPEKNETKKMRINAHFENKSMDPYLIDQKITELINERLLKLAKIGLKHELTMENLLKYIKTHKGKTKLYKLADYFSEDNLSDIENMLKYLHFTGVIKKDKNNWYSLK